ncbi:hypothetical protein M1P56_12455 [Streptomyces sp. HU2014]|uniref:hypothetical protein n=1 Tax=Streptomyces sp. HU2014 TaxID=2939414 RepID=UPI00200D4533|nr:hypothetical protein [Streptomyces sp. HU2014]UQI45103.1 hypothetical protein M1P56_12455 [Streptomyces sp. HU2014]
MSMRDRIKGAFAGHHGREEGAKARAEPGGHGGTAAPPSGRAPGRTGERETRARLEEVRRKADDDVDPHEWPDQGDGTGTPV